MPDEARIDEPGGGMGQQAEASERTLALHASGEIVGQGDPFERRRQHELAGVQDERLIGAHLDQPGQIGLFLSRIDERVQVVVEQPEVAIQAHVDARRLDHRRLERLQADPSAVDLGGDVSV